MTTAVQAPAIPTVVVRSVRSSRNAALDYTKGALVLIMVLYHWLNYFYVTQADIFRYLRFLTPSFIFITGFLISNIYLSKYGVTDPKLPRRLVERGLKVIAVFAVLNLARACSQPGTFLPKLVSVHSSISSILAIYVFGTNLGAGDDKAIAFTILLPIGYLLILSALVLFACRVFAQAFYVVFTLFLAATVTAGALGYQSTNLELLTIGLLGVMLGYIPIEKIDAIAKHPAWLFAGYALYLAAIIKWNVLYPLQIAGVCLSVAILYWMGNPGHEPGPIRSHIVLLGKYSLFGYIAQIAILQVMHRALRSVDSNPAVLAASFIAAFALTILTVEAADRIRRNSTAIDKLYKAVFA